MAAKHQTPGAGNEAAATATPKDRPTGDVYLDVYSKDLLVQSLVQVGFVPLLTKVSIVRHVVMVL